MISLIMQNEYCNFQKFKLQSFAASLSILYYIPVKNASVSTQIFINLYQFSVLPMPSEP